MIRHWIPCKICGKWHDYGLGDTPGTNKISFNFLPPDGRVQCPDNPGQSAEYHSNDIVPATDEEIAQRPHPYPKK